MLIRSPTIRPPSTEGSGIGSTVQSCGASSASWSITANSWATVRYTG